MLIFMLLEGLHYLLSCSFGLFSSLGMYSLQTQCVPKHPDDSLLKSIKNSVPEYHLLSLLFLELALSSFCSHFFFHVFRCFLD